MQSYTLLLRSKAIQIPKSFHATPPLTVEAYKALAEPLIREIAPRYPQLKISPRARATDEAE